MARFDGYVAVVTGGASGIGRATWQRLAADGAEVIALDIDDSQREALLEGYPRVRFIRHDVRSRGQWQDLMEEVRAEYGRLDILVNSAGILQEGTVESTEYADWHRMLAVNLDGTFWGCQAALPLLRDSGRGAIVNLSSVSGLKGDLELVAYDASKAAVCQLSKEIALFCAAQNYQVRCNSVHPGIVGTAMIEQFFATSELAQVEEWRQPDGRTIRPEEVAAMITWLASPQASFVTGAEYVIDGGLSA